MAESDTSSVRSTAAVEHLTWTQDGTPNVFQRFDIIVDSVRTGLIGVSCRPIDGDSECEVPLPRLTPGTHTLQLVAVTPYGESTPSVALQIVIEPTITSPGGGTSAPKAADRRAPTMTCAADRCFTVSVLAQGAGVIDRVAVLPDGRALLVRNGREVLVLGDRGVDVAYEAQSDARGDESISDIAVDPAFARTRRVYLAIQTFRQADGQRSVRIVRARELGGRLGEQTTIVPDIRVMLDSRTPLAVDANGQVYVSLPGRAAATRDPQEGAVLAFTSDGEAAGAALGSPVLARVAQRPASMLVSSNQAIWVAEGDQALSTALRVLRRGRAGVETFTVSDRLPEGDVAVRAMALTSATGGVMAVAPSEGLFVFNLSPDGASIATRDRLSLANLQPMAIAVTVGGDLLVTAIDSADQGRSTVLRLSPAPAIQ